MALITCLGNLSEHMVHLYRFSALVLHGFAAAEREYYNPSCVLEQAVEAQRQHEEEDFQFEALCGHGVNGGRKPLFKV